MIYDHFKSIHTHGLDDHQNSSLFSLITEFLKIVSINLDQCRKIQR
jgi:hypothetical protein